MARKLVKKSEGAPDATRVASASSEFVACAKCGVKQVPLAIERGGPRCFSCGGDLTASYEAATGKKLLFQPLDPSKSFQDKPRVLLPEKPAEETLRWGAGAAADPPTPEAMLKVLEVGGYKQCFTVSDILALADEDRAELEQWALGKRSDKPRFLVAYDRELNTARMNAGVGAAPPPLHKAPAAAPSNQTRPAPNDVYAPMSLLELVPAEAAPAMRTSKVLASEVVEYVWAEEMIRVAEFCTVRVGPFAGATSVREGETRPQALLRLKQDIVAFAEAERGRKVQSYVDALKGVKRLLKEQE